MSVYVVVIIKNNLHTRAVLFRIVRQSRVTAWDSDPLTGRLTAPKLVWPSVVTARGHIVRVVQVGQLRKANELRDYQLQSKVKWCHVLLMLVQR